MPPTLKRVDSRSSDDTLIATFARSLERPLGETEVSYFLPSRESGVNDMYLHLGFRAPPEIMKRRRVSLVWAMLRLRHPLLASRVEMHSYEDIRFVYMTPESVLEALESAEANLDYRSQTKDDLIDTYLNGPRTLSSERLSYLIVSHSQVEECSQTSEDLTQEFDLLLCATHFLGDGMALHQFANDFFTLLASGRADEDLESMLTEEWHVRWGGNKQENISLPSSLEERFPPMSDGKFRRAVSRVDFAKSQDKLIGGQSFPRRFGKARKTVVPTISIDPERTKQMLKKCKAQSTSISSAMFAICNWAWARTCDRHWELPTMMYSALNLRPVLTASKSLNDSYWYLAIGYFNVVLPSFIPQSASDFELEKTFWHRARVAKNQSTRAAKSAMLVSRSYEMAFVRGRRARSWAREDDEKALGIWKAPSPPPLVVSEVPKKPPSTALIGLSLLGNLDGTYKHATFPIVKLHTLTTGSRQRTGGMLLFAYTFVSRLWISLGYDQGGFEPDTMERFWGNVLTTVDAFLV